MSASTTLVVCLEQGEELPFFGVMLRSISQDGDGRSNPRLAEATNAHLNKGIIMSTTPEDFSHLTFELKMALAEAVHNYVAKSKLPLDSVVSLNMAAKVEADHYDTGDFDAFCDFFAALNVNIAL